LAVRWFESILNKTEAEIAVLFTKYRLSEALMAVYKLFWDEFSSWYLEMIKPAYGLAIDGATYEATLSFFDKLLKLLHPFMPFITEELWQQVCERKEGESIMVSLLAPDAAVDETLIGQFETAKEIIGNVRTVRLQKNMALKEALELQVIGHHPAEALNAVIIKMCNLSAIVITDTKAGGGATFMVGTTEFAVPLTNSTDPKAEIARMETELKYKEGFLQGILKKLTNEKFVNNAPPAVLEMERKKQADAESIIKSLKEGIEALRKSK
jgi:valyl-tRNA synthetase